MSIKEVADKMQQHAQMPRREVNGLHITEVTVRLPPNPNGKMLAFASIVLNDEFIVTDLKVIQGLDGLFVAMPSRYTKASRRRDVAHPLTAECRQMIDIAVLTKFEKEIGHEDQRRED